MNLLAAFRKFWYVDTPDAMQRKMLRGIPAIYAANFSHYRALPICRRAKARQAERARIGTAAYYEKMFAELVEASRRASISMDALGRYDET